MRAKVLAVVLAAAMLLPSCDDATPQQPDTGVHDQGGEASQGDADQGAADAASDIATPDARSVDLPGWCGPTDALIRPESAVICSDPTADYDKDGISNGAEGCLVGQDMDADFIPDWLDTDSDDDGIPDCVEAGPKDSSGNCAMEEAPAPKSWPCDADGDKIPNHNDLDSDNDGLLDKNEDPSGDGLVGCCLAWCNVPGSPAQNKCKLNASGCGSGQTCAGGKCTPTAALSCSDGETSPYSKKTF